MPDQPSAPRTPLPAAAATVADGQPRRLRVTIGATALALEVAGTGTPSLVLEAGGGLGMATWDAIWPPLTQLTRVVRYDRAGLGASDPPPPGRTYAELASTCHALLQAAHVPPPYVVVGHSVGGLLVRFFAALYPAEVGGVVLIDAVESRENQRALDLLPPERANESAHLARLRRAYTASRATTASRPLEQDAERLNVAASEDAAQALGSLAALPLVVLTAGRPFVVHPETPADVAAFVRDRWHPMIQELQTELAHLSTRSKHIYARRSGHLIHQDEPEVVVAAIRDLVGELRAGSAVQAKT